MKLKLKQVDDSYEIFKKCALKAYQENEINKAIGYIKAASKIAYNINNLYTDADLEMLLEKISQYFTKYDNNKIKNSKLVFFDSFGWDNRGLTQQYIRALISNDNEFMFIFENFEKAKSENIYNELKNYEKCKILKLDNNVDSYSSIIKLREHIESYDPDIALLHLNPWAAEALIAFNCFPSITKYQINLTDHAYWLGSSCINYSLEFRHYGCNVSHYKRGLKKEQLLLQPFYPICESSHFEGFPIENLSEKIKVFSGGSLYKIYGKDKLYFRIIKRLLDENPSMIIFYAGGGDSKPITQFLRNNNLTHRFILLGHRKDITEIFKNCDLYLGTYPITGGLMSQYAAVNSKPILTYTTKDIPCNDVEGIVCHNKTIAITKYDLEDFFIEARRLCNDEDYRISKGKSLKQCVIKVDNFNNSLMSNLDTVVKNIDFLEIDIDYSAFTDLYLEVENNYTHTIKKIIFSTLKYKLLLIKPLLFFKIICTLSYQKILNMFKVK